MEDDLIQRLSWLLGLLVVTLCSAPLSAQTPPPAGQSTAAPAAVTGVVRDASGGVVRGAQVTATPASGAAARAVTDGDGRFTVTPGGSGAITFVVRATGFSDGVQRIAVGANRQDLVIVLAAAPRTETINVSPPPAPPRPPAPPPPAVPAGPAISLWYGGLITGSAKVQKSGGAVGAEAGARVWKNLDLFLEGGSFEDVVTSKEQAVANPLTSFLQSTQAKAASFNQKMPAVYGGMGARWVFENVNIAGWARPYAQFSFGAARFKRQPSFTLGGSDVTSSLAQYGVTLGSDLTATERHGVVGGGFGVLVPWRFLYVDVGYRITSIRSPGQPINVNRFNFGVGARF